MEFAPQVPWPILLHGAFGALDELVILVVGIGLIFLVLKRGGRRGDPRDNEGGQDQQ